MNNCKYKAETQIGWIINQIKKIDTTKIKKVVAETNSIGEVYLSLLKKDIKSVYSGDIVEFTTSNTSKREIIENLVAEIGKGNITLYENDEQRREFSAYAMEITPTGKITYNAPYGLHDDIVMASAMAINTMRKTKTKSNYSISFGNKQHRKTLAEKYG